MNQDIVPLYLDQFPPGMKLLIHVCCAPDAVHVFHELNKKLDIHGFFYNPNIYPADEYELRKKEVEKICSRLDVNLVKGNYDQEKWLESVKGLETEPEAGKRCELCYTFRLNVAANEVKKNNLDGFATVLTVSPHKKAARINQVGMEIAKIKKIMYIPTDFKKRDGFKKSVELSKKWGIYRQEYCGCRFSIR